MAMKLSQRCSRSSVSWSDQRGLTIIELLIVMAMAGIILMLVIMAIPALQRNAHNSNRKQDAATVLEAVSHYQLNNSGNLPPSAAAPNFFISKLYTYDSSNVGIHAQAPATAVAKGPNTNLDTIDIYNYEICIPGGGATNQGAGYNDIVALYAIETSGATVGQCQQL